MTAVLRMSEADLLQAVRDLAKLKGYRCYHTHRSDRSEPGFPDLVMLRKGRLIFAELKSDTGKLRPEQSEWVAGLRVLGQFTTRVEVHVWRPDDLRGGTIAGVLA